MKREDDGQDQAEDEKRKCREWQDQDSTFQTTFLGIVFFSYDKIHNSFNFWPMPSFNISSESSFHALSFELWKVGEVHLWWGCESRYPYLD